MHIQLNAISCHYGPHQALFEITLNCKSGETLVLLGPSGSGKSSLLRVLNLLKIPSSGALYIDEHQFNFIRAPSDQSIRNLRKKVGIVFQQYNLWPHFTVLKNLIEAPIRVLGLTKAKALKRADGLMRRLHLTDFTDRFPLYLSSGQQQRVAIARALMMKPKVMLFDEPTSALDPGSAAQILNIIQELANSGITQVVVTHQIEVARKIASHIIYMENGRIVEQGDRNHFTRPQTMEFANYLSY